MSREPVGLAVAAAEQEDEHLVGQVLDRMLARLRADGVGRAGVADDEVGRRRSVAPAGATIRRADVAEAVAIVGHRECAGSKAMRVRASIRSGTREGWTLSTSSIGVGCGHS